MSAKKYPIGALSDIAAIPDEVLPRFLDELPRYFVARKQIIEGIPTLAAEARKNARWPLSWMPQSAFETMLIRQLDANAIWVDDSKGTVTVTVRQGVGEEPFFTQTEKLPSSAGPA